MKSDRGSLNIRFVCSSLSRKFQIRLPIEIARIKPREIRYQQGRASGLSILR